MKIKKNGKVFRLTESDLKKIVKKVLVTEEAMADTNLRGVQLKFAASLPGNHSYQPNEKVTGHFQLKAPTSGNATQSGGKDLMIYGLDYEGININFKKTANKVRGVVGKGWIKDKQQGIVTWKVPFEMTVTPELTKAMAEAAKDKRLQVGTINVQANISGALKPITVSAFPANTNINSGASPGRN